MSKEKSSSLPDAVDLLQVQHLEARDFVQNTLKYSSTNPDYPRHVIAVMQVLATNQPVLGQAKAQ